MGQYFKAANLDKREVVCPWCLGGGAKLWEWAANSYGAVFTLLLRKSSSTGRGDFYDPLSRHRRIVELDSSSPGAARESVDTAIREAAAVEGQSISPEPGAIVGRWAGDCVVLVGDYDESNLWAKLPDFRNISKEVVEAWNRFIELDDRKLTYDPDCVCRRSA